MTWVEKMFFGKAQCFFIQPFLFMSFVPFCLQTRIAFLQGERKGQECLKNDLVRRIKMLEYALRQERYVEEYSYFEQNELYGLLQ